MKAYIEKIIQERFFNSILIQKREFFKMLKSIKECDRKTIEFTKFIGVGFFKINRAHEIVEDIHNCFLNNVKASKIVILNVMDTLIMFVAPVKIERIIKKRKNYLYFLKRHFVKFAIKVFNEKDNPGLTTEFTHYIKKWWFNHLISAECKDNILDILKNGPK